MSSSSRLREYVPRLLIWLTTGIALLYLLAAATGWAGLSQRVALSDLAFLPVGCAAVVLAILCTAAQTGRYRRTWLLISLGLIAYLLGNVAWFVFQDVLHVTPFPSIADAGYLACYPLMLAGLLSIPGKFRTKTEAAGFWLDTLALLFGAGMIVALVLVIPALQSGNGDPLTAIVSAAYPLGDLLLVFGLVSLVLRRALSMADRGIVLLMLGLVVSLVSDLVTGLQEMQGVTVTGGLTDALLMVSWALLAWAAFATLTRPWSAPARPSDRLPAVVPVFVPYISAVVGFGLVLYAARNQLSTTLGELLLAAVAFVPVLLTRHALALRENGALQAARATHESEARFRALVTNSTDAILVTDADGTVGFVTPSAASVLGYGEAELQRCWIADLVHPDERQSFLDTLASSLTKPQAPLRGEWRLRARDGHWQHTETIIANLLADPRVQGLVFTVRDVEERVRLEQELRHQAFHDSLTGLGNRALFGDRVSHALRVADRVGGPIAVLFLDIDDFKLVNDSQGHAFGDAVLVQVAERLCTTLRSSDTAVRLGGDEFAILLEREVDLGVAVDVAQRIVALFERPFRIHGVEIRVRTSIGIALRSEPGREAEELLRDADVAMYAAKARGKDCFVVFEPAMQAAVEERLQLETDLRLALERGELIVHYQPIVEIPIGRIVGVEALVRWHHPVRGLLLPASFIEIAEDSGLIFDLGREVLRQACAQVRAWDEHMPGNDLSMAVNVSPRQVGDPKLVGAVEDALSSAGVDPARLTLEMTETALLKDTHSSLVRLRALKALGIRLALDDFGTGYSSLSHLHQLPVDMVKIAQAFVDHIAEGVDQTTLARTIITLGQALHLDVVAEGIANAEQLQTLESLGCELGQGFLLARPMPPERVAELVTATVRCPARGILI